MATPARQAFEKELKEFVNEQLPSYSDVMPPRVAAFLQAAVADLKASYEVNPDLNDNPVRLALAEWRKFAQDLANPFESVYSACLKLNNLQETSGVKDKVKAKLGVFRLHVAGGDLLTLHPSKDPSALQVASSLFTIGSDHGNASALDVSSTVEVKAESGWTPAQKDFAEKLKEFSQRLHKLRPDVAPSAFRLLHSTARSIGASFEQERNLNQNPVQMVLVELERTLDHLMNPLISMYSALSWLNKLSTVGGIRHSAIDAHFGQLRLVSASGVDMLLGTFARELRLEYPISPAGTAEDASGAANAPGTPKKVGKGGSGALVGSP